MILFPFLNSHFGLQKGQLKMMAVAIKSSGKIREILWGWNDQDLIQG